jgi:2-succinyl-5-enolpyruvyl-6-hydroxy-3-cyclohexene-1-carboxylate synthase
MSSSKTIVAINKDGGAIFKVLTSSPEIFRSFPRS